MAVRLWCCQLDLLLTIFEVVVLLFLIFFFFRFIDLDVLQFLEKEKKNVLT